jgi:hypothetical protein
MKFGQKPKNLTQEELDSGIQSLKRGPVSEKEVEEPKDLNSLAFSVTRNPNGGYALVTLNYNPVTMQSKVSEVKRVSDNREEAEYYFRVAVGEYFAKMEANS